jgi:hypothetical protein
MADYQVQAPDGKILTIEGPDDATDEQLQQQASQLYKQHLESQKQSQQGTGSVKPTMTNEEKFLQAIKPGPIENFKNNVMNSMLMGIPNYIASIGSPEYRQHLKDTQTTGSEITGDIAGLMLPVGAGAKLGVKAGGMLGNTLKQSIENPMIKKLIQENKDVERAYQNLVKANSTGNQMLISRAGQYFDELTKPMLKQAETTAGRFITPAAKIAIGGAGGAAGAQLGVAAPDMAQLDFPSAVAKSAIMGETIGKIPYVGQFYNNTIGQLVPVGLSALDMIRQYNKENK